MWSLGYTLQGLAKTGHLPVGFQASRGIRSLFSPAGSAGISVSLLKNYLYTRTGRVVLEAIVTTFIVGADGAGNWALQGSMTAGTEPGGEECIWEAGFVFQFSRNSTGHGFVASGDVYNPKVGQMTFLVQGADPWISANWLDAFANGVFFYLADATGFNSLPDTANAATNNGFSELAPLQGATPIATNYVQTGSTPSGPSGPGGVDWNIPPTDDGGEDGGG